MKKDNNHIQGHQETITYAITWLFVAVLPLIIEVWDNINGKTFEWRPIDSDEYIDAREKKFKKILTPEQYERFRSIHPDPTGFFIE